MPFFGSGFPRTVPLNVTDWRFLTLRLLTLMVVAPGTWTIDVNAGADGAARAEGVAVKAGETTPLTIALAPPAIAIARRQAPSPELLLPAEPARPRLHGQRSREAPARRDD